MRWPPDQYDWPMHETSTQVMAAGHRWHVQTLGDGPPVVLLHGAGGAGQSWSYAGRILADTHTVVIPDLVGQGFTQAGKPGRFGLDAMAQDLSVLLQTLGVTGAAIIGHSAGGAIALRMVQQGWRGPVVCLNPALTGFQGVAGWLYPKMAKAMATLPFSAALFSRMAGTQDNVARLLAATGSQISPDMARRYLALIQDRDHVAGTLNMMAAWDLAPLLQSLPTLAADVAFVLAENDQTVPPQTALDMAHAHPRITAQTLPGLGHLAHEEAADTVAQAILPHLTKERGTRAAD